MRDAASCPKYGGKVCRPEAGALCECYPGKKPSAANLHRLRAWWREFWAPARPSATEKAKNDYLASVLMGTAKLRTWPDEQRPEHFKRRHHDRRNVSGGGRSDV